jgi:hypothetical protein
MNKGFITPVAEAGFWTYVIISYNLLSYENARAWLPCRLNAISISVCIKGEKVKVFPTLNELSITDEDVWESGGIAPPFLTTAIDGTEWSASRPYCFNPGETPLPPGTHWVGGWVGVRASLDVMKDKSFSCRESNPGRLSSSPSLYRLSYRGAI